MLFVGVRGQLLGNCSMKPMLLASVATVDESFVIWDRCAIHPKCLNCLLIKRRPLFWLGSEHLTLRRSYGVLLMVASLLKSGQFAE